MTFKEKQRTRILQGSQTVGKARKQSNALASTMHCLWQSVSVRTGSPDVRTGSPDLHVLYAIPITNNTV